MTTYLAEIVAKTVNEAQPNDGGTDIITFINAAMETLENLRTIVIAVVLIILVVFSVVGIVRRSKRYTSLEIKKLRESEKYIPGVFVEMNESKEVIRYFIRGEKWKKRIIRKFNELYNNYCGDILKAACLDNNVIFKMDNSWSSVEVEGNIEKALEFHEKARKREMHFKEEYRASEPMIEYAYYRYIESLNTLRQFAKASNRRYLILTGSAGNGKTNLLCSISELLINVEEAVLLLNAGSIKGDVDEVLLNALKVPQQIRTRRKYYYALINAILFIRRKHLFIVIDAINENDDPEFGDRIHNFINEMMRYSRFKVIVSCRNEYYKERFAGYLTNEIAVPFFEFDLKDDVYSEGAKQRIIRKYRDYYNYTGHISPSALNTLQGNLLLLRIFFVVHKNSQEETMTIYRQQLFAEYIEQIKTSDASFEKVLEEAINIMIERDEYNNVEVQYLFQRGITKDEIRKATDGNILFSKRIIEHENTIASKVKEELYFVFDELRDYCIAKRIVTAHTCGDHIDSTGIIAKLESLREKKATCEEGVIHYVYELFRTTGEFEEGQRDLCTSVLDMYRISDGYKPRYYHNLHRSEFQNIGLRIVLSSGSPLKDFELDYITECLVKGAYEDGGKLFDELLMGSLHGDHNDLDVYLKIIFSMRKLDEIISMVKSIYAHNGINDINLPYDLKHYHQRSIESNAKCAKQIQRIAELILLVRGTKGEDEEEYSFRDYFFSLPNHLKIRRIIESQLKDVVDGGHTV